METSINFCYCFQLKGSAFKSSFNSNCLHLGCTRANLVNWFFIPKYKHTILNCKVNVVPQVLVVMFQTDSSRSKQLSQHEPSEAMHAHDLYNVLKHIKAKTAQSRKYWKGISISNVVANVRMHNILKLCLCIFALFYFYWHSSIPQNQPPLPPSAASSHATWAPGLGPAVSLGRGPTGAFLSAQKWEKGSVYHAEEHNWRVEVHDGKHANHYGLPLVQKYTHLILKTKNAANVQTAREWMPSHSLHTTQGILLKSIQKRRTRDILVQPLQL